MRMRVRARVLMLIWVCLLVAANAHAEDAAVGENGFVGLQTGKAYLNLPSEKAVITILGQPFGESAHRFWGENFEASDGFRLPGPQGTHEDGLRIEAAFNYLSADGSDRFSSSLPLGFFAIDRFNISMRIGF